MIQIQNLTKSFHTRTLFRDVTYQFPVGEKVALVGANGAGKTTLLNILCGHDVADDGFVRVPDRCIVGYLPQEPNASPKPSVRDECVEGASHLTHLKTAMDKALVAMESDTNSDAMHAFEAAETAFRTAGGYAIEAKADRVLTGLGFLPHQLTQNPKELSGGWRMRLELAKLFLREPDFLILDEPTNHLDLPSLVWVEGYLQTFPGTLLFVSHDRALLNRLSTLTLNMEGGSLKCYTGNFDSFLEQREQHLEQEMKAAEGLRKRREHMEKFVERFGAKATKARQAQSRQKMIARIRTIEAGMASDSSQETMGIVIPEPPRSPRIACEVRQGAIGYGSNVLATGIELMVEKGAKVAIIGANGIGKSTFLKTLAGILAPLGGEFSVRAEPFAYFAQDQLDVLTPEKTVLENLLARSTLGEPAARSLLGGLLFHGDDVFKPVKVLSGGEKSRVGLAAALAQKAACLMLDEPTNHLDMASVESLADGLSQYSGTVLFVSHDRQFIDDLSTHVFVMLPDGRSQLFIGKIEDYRRNAAASGFPDIFLAEQDTKPSTSPGERQTRPDYDDRKEKKKLKQKLTSQSTKFEADMESLRRQITDLDEKLAGAGAADLKKITALHKEKTDLESQLQSTEEAWLAVAEELDNI